MLRHEPVRQPDAGAAGRARKAHPRIGPDQRAYAEAGIDVLCADKTGTLTRNALALTVVQGMPGFTEAQILALAALACSDGQDPVDAAIHAAAAAKPFTGPALLSFTPFDPARKLCEATVRQPDGTSGRVAKEAAAVFLVVLDAIKTLLFRHLQIA